MSALRLCRDCSFFSPSGDCEYPDNIRIDLVNGGRKHIDTPSMLREGVWTGPGRCGEKGRRLPSPTSKRYISSRAPRPPKRASLLDQIRNWKKYEQRKKEKKSGVVNMFARARAGRMLSGLSSEE